MSNQDQMEERASRLRARRSGGPNATALALIALMTGVGAGGAGVWYLANQSDEPTGPVFDTSASREFQRDSDTGLTPVITPSPEFRPQSQGPTAAEVELAQRVEELEQALETARNQGPIVQETPVIDTAQLDALQIQMEGLASAAEAREAELENQLAAIAIERDELSRERTRMEAELSGLTMRLEQAENNTAEQMRLAQHEQAERTRLAEEERLRQEAEEERFAELERRRREAEALLQAQINSPIDGLSGGSADASAREYTGDEAFIRAGSDTIAPTQSRVIGAPSNTVMQGTVIEATLTSGINSELSGTISSTVSYDVWSFDMRRVLIPRGSQMFGRYSNNVVLGQRRVLVAWDRLVTPNGQVVDLEAYGADGLGRSGLTGDVDNRGWERFGSAAAISVFAALPSIAAARADSDTTVQIAENIGSDAETVSSSLVQQYLSLAPIITVEHGSVITVMVTNDLELF